MIIDYWYGDGRSEQNRIAFVTCTFYPNEGIYRGNMWDKDKKPIGDYSSKDSLEIEKRFPGIFG